MKARCPHCKNIIDMVHNGTEDTMGDERTEPWVFVSHDIADIRMGVPHRVTCPASGRNRHTAAHHW